MLAFLLLASIFGPQSCVCTSHVNEIRATTWSTARQTELATEHKYTHIHISKNLDGFCASAHNTEETTRKNSRRSQSYTCLREDANALNRRLFARDLRAIYLTIIGSTDLSRNSKSTVKIYTACS